jgi:hypothetical protein
MGTRGFVGFVAGGDEKIGYNHCDSYPEVLGVGVLRWLRGACGDIDKLVDQASALRVVTGDDPPTDEDIARLSAYADTRFSTRDPHEWCVLLHGTQGDPAAILAAGAIEDASEFPLDSLFAGYGYLVDLDTRVFEAYRGHQHSGHDKGRFAGRTRTGSAEYWPCALVGAWRLDALPSDAEFVAAVHGG